MALACARTCLFAPRAPTLQDRRHVTKRPALLATLIVFVFTIAALFPFGAAQAAEPQDATKPIPLIFHLPDGDVPSLINPSTIQVMFNPRE